MPDKELENLAADDVFLEHLLDLQTHAGFQKYQEWLAEQLATERRALERDAGGYETVKRRGKIEALKMCQAGLQTIIDERRQELQEREQS